MGSGVGNGVGSIEVVSAIYDEDMAAGLIRGCYMFRARSRGDLSPAPDLGQLFRLVCAGHSAPG